MGAPRALRRQSIDFFGSRPAFRRAQHDHRPARSRRGLAEPRGLLDRGDLVKHAIEGGGHQLVHLGGLVAGYLYLKGGRIHLLSELKYRYLKWRINRMRRKFDVYSGGRADDVNRRVH